MLTLKQAIEAGQLDAFIKQEEAKYSSIDKADLDVALSAMIKSPRSEDQISHSPSGDSLNGK